MYNDKNKDELHALIEERGIEGTNSGSSKADLIAALEADDKAKGSGSGKSTEQAGVGTPEEPENTPIPEAVKIKHEVLNEQGTKITAGASVRGNQSLLIIDVMQGKPVEVFMLEAKAFRPELDGALIFIQGAVSNNFLPYAQARTRFAVKKDGTVIYNDRGFDDVAADYDLVDIVKLIEHNHGNTPEETDQPLTAEERS